MYCPTTLGPAWVSRVLASGAQPPWLLVYNSEKILHSIYASHIEALIYPLPLYPLARWKGEHGGAELVKRAECQCQASPSRTVLECFTQADG